MKRYCGGDTVTGGLYLKLSSWEFHTVRRERGVLPGENTTRYLRVPVLAVMVVAPFLGLAYVIFLPVLLGASLVRLSAHKVRQALRAEASPAVGSDHHFPRPEPEWQSLPSWRAQTIAEMRAGARLTEDEHRALSRIVDYVTTQANSRPAEEHHFGADVLREVRILERLLDPSAR